MNIEIKEDVNTNTKDLKNLLKVKKDVNVEINGSVAGEQVYISLDDFKELLKVKKETKTIKLIFGNQDELVIEKNGSGSNKLGTIKKSLNYLDLEIEEISTNILESIDYSNEVSIGIELLTDMFYESAKYSGVCTIETNKKGIYFKETGEIGDYEAFYSCDNLKSYCCNSSEIGMYSYAFLNVIENFLKIMEKDDTIKIYQKTEQPLKIVIVLKRINTTITYYVAFRVKTSELDNDNKEDF